MNCEQARARLDAYLDDETDAVGGRRLAEHLAGCPRCRADSEARRTLRADLQAGLPYHRAPGALRDRLSAALDRRASPRRWAALAASLALAALLGAGLGAGGTYWAGAIRAERALATELVAGHVRARLVEGRLTDVASADRHTVRPWFGGRLDFAPPVHDFGGEGYALAGGRLDYIGGRPVAALVYRHRLHVVDLFVWPAEGADSDGAWLLAHRGYHLAGWRAAGLQHWLVSDLNPVALGDLARLMRRSEAPGR